MEALILTLDMISMILLCIGVIRFTKSGDPESLGLFAFKKSVTVAPESPRKGH